MLHYNKQWENELIYRIAKRLARVPGDVEMLFGVFSRGTRSVTKEDFKYTCLKRLQMSKDISEREMDMFLRGCPRLAEKEIVGLEDFLMLFSASITQARHDILDEDAMQLHTIQRYQQMQRTAQEEGVRDSRSSVGFTEKEILDILAKMRS